jgi:hypothetical protein
MKKLVLLSDSAIAASSPLAPLPFYPSFSLVLPSVSLLLSLK